MTAVLSFYSSSGSEILTGVASGSILAFCGDLSCSTTTSTDPLAFSKRLLFRFYIQNFAIKLLN